MPELHLDPPLAAIFAGLAGAAAAEAAAPTHAERRAAADATLLLLQTGPEPGSVVAEHQVPVAGGAITVRVTRPAAADGPLPAFVFLHGGGWSQGTIDTGEVECGPVVAETGCVLVSPAYRLAPEHPAPIPLDDCLATWAWVHDHAEELGIDPTRVAVGGTSAGANLAAALCLACRDRGLVMPIAQLLDVPALDLTGYASPDGVEGAGLTRAGVQELIGFYLADGAVAASDPLVSPLLADDLSGLPPAVVIVAEHDPVRDDGELWVQRLQEAGVAAAGFRVLTHVHGSWMIPITVTSRVVHDLRISTLRRAFAGTLAP